MNWRNSILSAVAAFFVLTTSAVTVTSLEDSDAVGTLRWAVEQTQASEIDFAPSLIGPNGEATVYFESQLSVKRNITIRGLSDGVVVLDASRGHCRHFYLAGSQRLKLESLTLVGGQGRNGKVGYDGNDGLGGSIYVESGSLFVTNCAFEANSAGIGGACFLIRNACGTFKDVSFSGNTATYQGGGAVAVLGDARGENTSSVFRNCTFVGNSANGCPGGALYVMTARAGGLDIDGSTFYNNEAQGAGAIHIWSFDRTDWTKKSVIRRVVAVGNRSTGTSHFSDDCYVLSDYTGSDNWAGLVSSDHGTTGWTLGKTVEETYADTTPVAVGGGTRRVVMPLANGIIAGDPTAAGRNEAVIGDTYYASLQSALKAVPEGGTVRLLRDVRFADQTLSFTRSCMLDGAGHSLKVLPNSACTDSETFRLQVTASDVALTNLKIRAEGELTPRLLFVDFDAALTLRAGTDIGDFAFAESPVVCRVVQNHGRLAMESGSLIHGLRGVDEVVSVGSDGVFTLAGGVLEDCVFATGSKRYLDGRAAIVSGGPESQVTLASGAVRDVAGRGVFLYTYTDLHLDGNEPVDGITLGGFVPYWPRITVCANTSKPLFFAVEKPEYRVGSSNVLLVVDSASVFSASDIELNNPGYELVRATSGGGFVLAAKELPPEPEPVIEVDPIEAAWKTQSDYWQTRLVSSGAPAAVSTNLLAEIFEAVARTNGSAVADERLVATSNLLESVVAYITSSCWCDGSFYTSLGDALDAEGDSLEKIYLLKDLSITTSLTVSGRPEISGEPIAFADASAVALGAFSASERASIAAAVKVRIGAVREIERRTVSTLTVDRGAAIIVAFGDSLNIDHVVFRTAGDGVRTSPFIRAVGSSILNCYEVTINGQRSAGASLIDASSLSNIVALVNVYIQGNTNSVAGTPAVKIGSDGGLLAAGRDFVADNIAADAKANVLLDGTARVMVTDAGLSGMIGLSGRTDPGSVFGSAVGTDKRPDAVFVNDDDPEVTSLFEGENLKWREKPVAETDYVSLGELPVFTNGMVFAYDGGGRRLLARPAVTNETKRAFVTVPSNAVVRLSNLVIDGTGAGWYGFADVRPFGRLVLENVEVRGFARGRRGSIVLCEDAKFEVTNGMFRGNAAADGVVLNLYTSGETGRVEIVRTTFMSNVCEEVVLSENPSARPSAHRFVDCVFDGNGDTDFLLVEGPTCLDGAFAGHVVTARLDYPELVTDPAEGHPQFVFTNALPVVGVRFDFDRPSLSAGSRIVGNPWSLPLPVEKVSFVPSDCAATAAPDGSLTLTYEPFEPTPGPVGGTGVSWKMIQTHNDKANLVIFEDGVTNAVVPFVCSNENVVVSYVHHSEKYGTTNIVDYLIHYDTDTRLLYVPDATHGNVLTEAYTTGGKWRGVTYGKQLDDDLAVTKKGEIYCRFNGGEPRTVGIVTIDEEAMTAIINFMLKNTEAGKKYQEEHEDYTALKIIGAIVGTGAGAGICALLGEFFLAPGEAALIGGAIEQAAERLFDLIRRAFDQGGGEHGNNHHDQGRDNGSDADSESDAGSEDSEGGGGGGSDPNKIKEAIDTALMIKDLYDTAKMLANFFDRDLTFRGEFYNHSSHKQVVTDNAADHGRTDNSCPVAVLRTCKMPDDTSVDNVFICYDASMSASDIVKGAFWDNTDAHTRFLSVFGNAANLYTGINLIRAHGWKARLSSCWSAVVSLATGFITRGLTYKNRNGYFDIGASRSYNVQNNADVCFQNMYFGTGESPIANRQSPLFNIGFGGIAEFKDSSFSGYTYAANACVIYVASGGTLILKSTKFTNCGTRPIVVAKGGKVWVSGTTEVDGLWIEDPASLSIGEGPRGQYGAKSANLSKSVVVYGLDGIDRVFGCSAFSTAGGWANVGSGKFRGWVEPKVTGSEVSWFMSDAKRALLRPVSKPGASFSIVPDGESVKVEWTIGNAYKPFVYTLEGAASPTGSVFSAYSGTKTAVAADGELKFSVSVPKPANNQGYFRIRVSAE